MIFTLKLQILLMRFFRRVKSAYAYSLPISHDLRSPFSLVSANPQKANFIGFSSRPYVLQIAKSSDLSQITKTIVFFIAVNMVNMVRRHFANYIKPRQSVRQSFNIVDSNTNVTRAMDRAGNFADKIRTPAMFAPSKNAGLRIIIQRLAQMFNGKVRFNCHDVEFTILRQI